MPNAAPRPCSSPGCRALVYGGGSRCPAHPKANTFGDRNRGTRQQRGYGGEWDKLRIQILERDCYLCQPCLRNEIVESANIVDHIQPKGEGGTDDPGNLQAICKPCHDAKTSDEARRGRVGRNLTGR